MRLEAGQGDWWHGARSSPRTFGSALAGALIACFVAAPASSDLLIYRVEGTFAAASVNTSGGPGDTYLLVVALDRETAGAPSGSGTVFSGGLAEVFVNGVLDASWSPAFVFQSCCDVGITGRLEVGASGVGFELAASFVGLAIPDSTTLLSPDLLAPQQVAGSLEEVDGVSSEFTTGSATLAQPSVLYYDFNESGNAPGSAGADRRPLKTRDDDGTALDFHSADGGGVSGRPGDRAFDNTGPSAHGESASADTNGFRADQGDNAAVDGLGAFTISGWFKTESSQSVLGDKPRLVHNHDGKSGDAGDGFNLQFAPGTDGDLKLEVDDDTGGGVSSTGAPYSAKQTWVFFAVSYDGALASDNVHFYRGFRSDAEAGGGPGAAVVSWVATASLDRGPVDDEGVGLHLGNRPDNDRPFDGLLDDIRIDSLPTVGAAGLATLESYRQRALAAPPAESLVRVDSTSIATSALDQGGAAVTVDELSGVSYDATGDVFWTVSDEGGRLLAIDVDFAADGSFAAAATASAVTLVDNLDFEGIAQTSAAGDRVFLSEETSPGVREYSLADGTLLGVASVPAVFANTRLNRGFEGLAGHPDASLLIAGLEQALAVDGPDGSSTSERSVSRLLHYATPATPGLQIAYRLEPAHGPSVGALGSGLSALLLTSEQVLLSVERSQADGELLTRIFRVDVGGATDVSQGSLASGLIGEVYIPAAKTLLYSDDRDGKIEGLALGPKLPSGERALLAVEDASASNVIRSFRYRSLPEPGALFQGMAVAGVLALLRRSPRRSR